MLVASDVGTRIGVRATFTDDQEFEETRATPESGTVEILRGDAAGDLPGVHGPRRARAQLWTGTVTVGYNGHTPLPQARVRSGGDWGSLTNPTIEISGADAGHGHRDVTSSSMQDSGYLNFHSEWRAHARHP